jgi:hypothetical protein
VLCRKNWRKKRRRMIFSFLLLMTKKRMRRRKKKRKLSYRAKELSRQTSWRVRVRRRTNERR